MILRVRRGRDRLIIYFTDFSDIFLQTIILYDTPFVSSKRMYVRSLVKTSENLVGETEERALRTCISLDLRKFELRQ